MTDDELFGNADQFDLVAKPTTVREEIEWWICVGIQVVGAFGVLAIVRALI